MFFLKYLSLKKPRRRTTLAGADWTHQVLEHRCLPAATVIAAISDVAIDSTPHSIPLADHFDDPDINGSTVEVTTPLGRVLIETYDSVTPQTAANFLSLVDGGNYDDMFFHRSIPGFVVQGGGFKWTLATNTVEDVANNGNVPNEFDRWFDPNIGGLAAGTPLNVRGTMAMAKLPDDPDSANSQWFVNLNDNSGNLDQQNGGFTVFARVLPQTMPVLDAIAALQRVNAGGPFATLPVRDYQSGETILRHHVVTSSSRIVPELEFEVTEIADPGLISAVIVGGQLQITPAAPTHGMTTVTVTATDLFGSAVSSTFRVGVGITLPASISGPTETNNRHPQLRWTDVPDAQRYELWINHVGVQNAIIHQKDITTNAFSPSSGLAPGLYRAWVRVHGPNGASDWSSAHSFRVTATAPDAVTLTSPTAQTTTDPRPVFEWTASEAALRYDLWVNRVGVQNQIIRNTSLTETSFTPDFDLPDGTYRAWVRAVNETGASSWSQPVTMEIDAGTLRLVTPRVNAESATPVFEWSGAPANASVELWVNQVNGTPRIIHERSLNGQTYTPTADLPAGRYRAWVRMTVDGSVSPWTSAHVFQIADQNQPGTVTFSSVTGTDTPRPTIAWQAAANAVRYELWINQRNGTPRIIHESQLTETQFTAVSDLPSGSYRGWLRAFNSAGAAGPWTPAFDFVIS